MADENEQNQKNSTDEVLAPKVRHEKQFLDALGEAHKMAHGALGWAGHAEMMYELGGIAIISAGEVKANPKWTKEEHIEAIKDLLQQVYMQKIMDHGEWVTREEAEKRRKATEILFGNKSEK